jgi:hypothetical protein
MWNQNQAGQFVFTSECGTVLVTEKRAGRRGWVTEIEGTCIGSVGKTGRESVAGLPEEIAIDFQKTKRHVPVCEYGQWDRLANAARNAAASWIVVPA